MTGARITMEYTTREFLMGRYTERRHLAGSRETLVQGHGADPGEQDKN
jgi:hypothetical protein